MQTRNISKLVFDDSRFVVGRFRIYSAKYLLFKFNLNASKDGTVPQSEIQKLNAKANKWIGEHREEYLKQWIYQESDPKLIAHGMEWAGRFICRIEWMKPVKRMKAVDETLELFRKVN